jgi:hypothetical protein
MKTFDFYEFTGVLCPGVVVLFSAAVIVPEFGPILRDQSLTVGDLGQNGRVARMQELRRRT